MSRPIVFSGKDAKLLTPRDIVGSDGNIFPKTGEKNYVNSPSAYTSSSTTLGWGVSGAGITASTDTTAADLPRPNTSKTGILLTGVSGSTAYAYYRFVLDDADAGKKLKFQFDMKPGTAVSSDFKVDVYSNTASDYTTGNTRLSLSTDSSAVSALPALTGTYRTTFDAPAITAKWIEVRVGLNQANVHTLVISDVVVGPGVVVQGAAVSGWTSYTPAVTNGGASTFTGTGLYRRNGDAMEVLFTLYSNSVASGSASTNVVQFSLPTGFTVNTSTIPQALTDEGNVIGFAETYGIESAGVYDKPTTVVPYTSTTCAFVRPNTAGYYQTTHLNSAQTRQFMGRLTVAVNEWAGAGTINVVQNDVEYAFSTDTSTSTAASSFGYGPGGVLVPSGAIATTDIYKTVQFRTPISATDIISLEVSVDGLKWTPVAQQDAGTGTQPFTYQNAVEYGMGIRWGSMTATTCDVYFGKYKYASGATYGAAGTNWGGGLYWRVKKASGGQAVGFSEVVPGISNGLVGAAGLKGVSTNSAAPAGYVGEYTQSLVTTATNYPGATNAWGDATSLSLTAGEWDVTFIVESRLNGASNSAEVLMGISATSGNSATGLTRGDNYFGGTQGTASANALLSICNYRVQLAATTTYYAKLQTAYSAGNPQYLCRFSARRMR